MEYDQACFEIIDSGNFIRITPIKLAHDSSSDDSDRDWIKSEIEISAGSFKGKFNGDLRITDINYFRLGLEHLYTHLNDELIFEDLEGYLKTNIKGDGNGHFEVMCTVSDNPGYMPSKLSFYLDFDQTQIMQMVRELNAIATQFSAKII
jgi:hypothetical protein